MDLAESIVTLPPKQISRFLVRHRRGQTLERYQPQLDGLLREILARANEFVPSEAGAILLDDPKAKMFDAAGNELTIIAAFGDPAGGLLGQRLAPDRGVWGRVYGRGVGARCAADRHPELLQDLRELGGLPVRSVLGVPVLLGNAVCGLILLVNRIEHDYSAADHRLAEIFAAYISSSIQNTLDGIRAKELAQRDDLTGLYNDRYLHNRLRAEIGRAGKSGAALSLLFIDLDRFKTINDHHGHLEGSRALHMVGILLEAEVPAGAVAARYGGDEFVVILPGTGEDEALAVAEHLRARVAQTSFLAEQPAHGSGGRYTITASLGVATLPPGRARAERSLQLANGLIRLADAAMYRAKTAGRDRVSVAAEEGLT